MHISKVYIRIFICFIFISSIGLISDETGNMCRNLFPLPYTSARVRPDGICLLVERNLQDSSWTATWDPYFCKWVGNKPRRVSKLQCCLPVLLYFVPDRKYMTRFFPECRRYSSVVPSSGRYGCIKFSLAKAGPCSESALLNSGKHQPRSIISLGPFITKQLYLLGADKQLKACTVYGPPEASRKIKIGNVVKINTEKIVSLHPDLVLATSLTDKKCVKKLKDIGLNVVIFGFPINFEALCRQFIKLGALTGKKQNAERIIANVKLKVNKIRLSSARFHYKPKMIIQIGAKPLWLATKNSFINDFIVFAGGLNLGPENSGIYSREKVLVQNPDIIIISNMGIRGKEEKKVWEKYRSLNAVKHHRIYIFDAGSLCSPTPVEFVEILERIFKIVKTLQKN